ncbi:translation initiation factor 2 [Ascoidea rubescens DSM 1968]|uniref:Translation initiation factor IF-2, mitochondrial n=1 Tax=Ascoidea rubescens DSM 1968 TaxID=1344418 RepID=A0A1D2VLN6_9ASCO|nr:mitochondrial translation initiation factor 2 [Ascoidea rubescens DSM 1968]ODV62526.1 mitochondrial translation initiation factor 2 [Ascoidea rubescens DSM 1968]
MNSLLRSHISLVSLCCLRNTSRSWTRGSLPSLLFQHRHYARPSRAISLPKASPKISLPTFISVANLANLLNVRYASLQRSLKSLGFSANETKADYILDRETSSLVANEFGFEVAEGFSETSSSFMDLRPSPPCHDPKKLKPRPPIVTIMGHVDHGKTTILDYLRKSSIVASEHGGITQHIGAFSFKTPQSKKMITFLDTPGHAAFLKMRERGANITDIAVLVVAADDSVMPQTKEAIKHCINAKANMIVAINKCDKADANPERVIQDLANNSVNVESFGGETQVIEVSGLTGLNMDKLEEAIITLSEIMDLKAETKGLPAEATIVESQVKKGLGNVATLIVNRGNLVRGDILVCGKTWCKIKTMKNEYGKTIKSVTPSMPAEITGWKDLPEAGDICIQAKSESIAKTIVSNRITEATKLKDQELVTQTNIQRLEHSKEHDENKRIDKRLLKLSRYSSATNKVKDEKHDETKIVPFIIKTDVSGSEEAVLQSISGIGNDEVQSQIIHSDVGQPNHSDLDRAEISGAQILCFNTHIPKDIAHEAFIRKIKISEYTIIYRLIEDVTDTLSSYLKPKIETTVKGHSTILQVFDYTLKKNKKIKVAGCKVENGVMKKNVPVRVRRLDRIIYKGKLTSLKHLKEEVREIKKGNECGMSFENWEDFKAGDIVEVYEEKEIRRFL